MRRYLINDQLRSYATQLYADLNALPSNPLTKLKDLKTKLTVPKQISYVERIENNWKDIVTLEPNRFDSEKREFDKILPENELSKKVGNREFYKYIVDAMRYDYVQKTAYPKLMLKMGIKTCVYCNAQYSFAVQDHGNTYINYELDHYRPKSTYPFLSTSFFNLQPCCAKCNKSKSNNQADFQLFTSSPEDIDPFEFSLDIGSSVRYWITRNNNAIKIKFSSHDQSLLDNHEKLFHISTLYQGHRDIVEEILWKKKIYNSTLQSIYLSQFKSLGFTDSDFKRFIIGNYAMPENIHKRPLAKMVQDVSSDLGLI